MSNPVGAVAGQNAQKGVKRSVQGNPVGVPMQLPGFRGRSVDAGAAVKAPKLRNGNLNNETSNVRIPYNRVTPLEFLSSYQGRLGPGDLIFNYKYAPGFTVEAGLLQQRHARREHPLARGRVGRHEPHPHGQRAQRLAPGRERLRGAGRARRVRRLRRPLRDGRHVCAVGAQRVPPGRRRDHQQRRAGGVHLERQPRQCHLQHRHPGANRDQQRLLEVRGPHQCHREAVQPADGRRRTCGRWKRTRAARPSRACTSRTRRCRGAWAPTSRTPAARWTLWPTFAARTRCTPRRCSTGASSR